MANAPLLGRQESVGVGLESVSGTQAATLAWQPHLALTLDRKTNTVENQSGMGRLEQTNDSAIVEQWAEGSLNGKIYWDTFGYFLSNIFGATPTASVHASETTVYDNAFAIAQTSVPPCLSLVRANSIATRGFTMGMLSDLEIDIKQQDWIQFTATVQTKTGATTTATAAYSTTEGDFTSKHATLSFAPYGSTSYAAAQTKSIKLKISRKLERFTPLGQTDPACFDIDSYTVTGTIVQRWTDTVLENIAAANTAQAMQLVIKNTDATIGTATNPSLTITCPKVRLDPATTDNKLDQTLSQTFNFEAQLDATGAGNLITAVLTNKKNGYTKS
ncbi:MAG TPA: phage tail tube protein [Candidatus Saccharimonadales bacterium]|nr:phage tail tube protein [Candidatus Saccharimonadales bacterium]